MTQYINHDLRSYDGGTIYMPPYIGGEEGWGNLAIPDVHVASAAQAYPRGTMFRKGTKSYVYTKLYTANSLTEALWGATGYGGISQGLGLFSRAIVSDALTIVTATKGEATLTVSSPALGTANAYAGGLLSMYESTALGLCVLGVVSHTATVITLDDELPGTYTAQSNTNARLIPSPYHSAVGTQNQQSTGGVFDYCPGIFISTVDDGGNDPAADDFVWLQTAGPCMMWMSGAYRGEDGGERTAVVMGDGAAHVRTGTENPDFQVIGTLLPSTGDTTIGANPGVTGAGADLALMTHIIMLNIRQ